jgi:hypothetical protein
LVEQYCVDRLLSIHSLASSDASNAKKQAKQIAACVRQAEEYFRAARAVSIVTRPLLLYYGCSALASAQILWKGTGDVSLDKMRADHGEHGLDRVAPSIKEFNDPAQLAQLKAKIVKKSGEPSGLFGLWRRTMRNDGAVGVVETHFSNGSMSKGHKLILGGEEPLPRELKGWNLLDLLKSLTLLRHSLDGVGIPSELVRATVSVHFTQHANTNRLTEKFKLVVHPAEQTLLDLTLAQIKFESRVHDILKITEPRRGVSAGLYPSCFR